MTFKLNVSRALPASDTDLTGLLVENFENNPRGSKILFCGRGFKCFSLQRGTNPKTAHYLLSYSLGSIS